MTDRTAWGRRRLSWCLPLWFAPLLLAVVLFGCSSKSVAPRPPVNLLAGDSCAVCGMYIKRFPGPRGEAYLKDYRRVLKFGSTRDFFAYVTRADVKDRLGAVYVQDSARIDWRHPSNSADSFVNARQAWYVAFQPLKGAMGPTLASFARKRAAQAFIRKHGGELLSFKAVTPALVSRLDFRCPPAGSKLLAAGGTCVSKGPAAPQHSDTPGSGPDAG